MGAKGRRRREKNFKAAHGGETRLPPPPTASQIDALPSKLRKIMLFKRGLGNPEDPKQGSVKKDAPDLKKTKKRMKSDSMQETDAVGQQKDSTKKDEALPTGRDGEVDIRGDNRHGAEKGKRKREVNDLRFSDQDDVGSANLSKRARRKKFLEERKKKHKKHKGDEKLEFPAREEIKFGEVVEAPPKLTLPRVSKAHPSASQERLRLQAIEAFRKQRKWTSRPGSCLPPLSATVPSGSP